jgi:hypothetical protein
MPSDFMQVLNSIRKHYTNNEYFYRHILFTKIYLLHEQKLNPKNYSKQEVIMNNFVYATNHNVNMYAKIKRMNMNIFL